MNRFSPHDLITLNVNGEAFSCTSPIFLNQLLEYLDFNVKTIIVEHNSKIVDRQMLNSIKLKSGDKIEIVTIVGGG
uniref:Thiamine biosynthesis protein S n=1 Tax=Erythrotrichia carnea TaxID=35151 RepID=A0A1C9CE64_9RHOD|nr:thiamine biosynthesis protein S [Erythrotrichia carnea]AOM66680.1 thiamine biosynthesis protein S [Erythrotrichia carnea]